MIGTVINLIELFKGIIVGLPKNLFDGQYFLTQENNFIGDVSFSGIDLILYYFYVLKNFYYQYPWQVRVSYFIVLLCITAIIFVFNMFIRKVIQKARYSRKMRRLKERFQDSFISILTNDILKPSEIENIVGCTEQELRKIDPRYFAEILTSERMKLYEIVYLPNLQSLADMTGVKERYEDNLLKGRDVFQTLQTLCMFQLIISEGRLANYVNSGDRDIRMMARMCSILCSINEPYRYLLEDLNAQQSMMRPMVMHYIFGWMKAQNKRMPNFLATSERIENEEMASFMIREVAYWGSDEEKMHISNYYLSSRRECRAAAIQVTGQLGMEVFEQRLIDSFIYQPEHLRRDIMRAVLAINSGKRIQFYVDAYNNTPSRRTRELCLNCLYSYGLEGRRVFEELRNKADEKERIMMEEIDSSNLLLQIRSFS